LYAIVRFAGFLCVVFVYEAFSGIETVVVKIAYGDDTGLVVFPDAGHIVPAGDAAVADGADVNAVTGGEWSAEHMRRDNGGKGSEGQGAGAFNSVFQEFSPCGMVLHIAKFWV